MVQRIPNVALRGVREVERQESRSEFADAMMRAAERLGESITPSERYVARLEDGDVRYPGAAYRRVLTDLCQRPASELGFASPLARRHGSGESEKGRELSDGSSRIILMRKLITDRHWQRYETFRTKFRKAAADLAEREQEPSLARLDVSERQFERWYYGKIRTRPWPDACRVLEHMFGCPVDDLLSPDNSGDSAQVKAVGIRQLGMPVFSTGIIDQSGEHLPMISDLTGEHRLGETGSKAGEEEEMERRRLLLDLAALGGAVSPATIALSSIRDSFNIAFAGNDANKIGDWGETVIEYGYAYLSTSPKELIPGIAADMIALRSIVARLSVRDEGYREWCRIGGTLACLMAKSLSNIGKVRESRQWWNTALQVSDASEDTALGLWIRGQRVTHGLYEKRPIPILLRQISEAASLGQRRSCPGLAELSTGRAQVSAISGDYLAAEQELIQAAEILSQLPDAVTAENASIMGWSEAQLRYTEAWVYAYMGDERKTDRAAHRALQLYPKNDSRSPAQIKLMQAFARIQSGDVGEGVRYAHATYEPLVSEQRTTMVDELARRILIFVPAQARNRPEVAEYRALMSLPDQRAMLEQ